MGDQADSFLLVSSAKEMTKGSKGALAKTKQRLKTSSDLKPGISGEIITTDKRFLLEKL